MTSTETLDKHEQADSLQFMRTPSGIDNQPKLEKSRRTSVSVIIPTHDRPEQLRRLLESLVAQTWPSGAMEIVVAQDGGNDATIVAVNAVRRDSSIPIRHVGHDRGSAAATRNLGAAQANGELLLFVDDDCDVDSRWIEEMVEAFDTNPHVGQVASRIVGGTPGFFARCHDYARYYPSLSRRAGTRSFACGCAFGIRSGIFKELGGFDETILTGEDEDLGLRMQDLGFVTSFRPESVVHHRHGRDTLGKMLQRARIWAARGEIDRHLDSTRNSTYGRFAFSNPWFYLLLAPMISWAVTARIWLRCWTEPCMPLYAPFIFWDKMVWCQATFTYLRHKRNSP